MEVANYPGIPGTFLAVLFSGALRYIMWQQVRNNPVSILSKRIQLKVANYYDCLKQFHIIFFEFKCRVCLGRSPTVEI